MQVVHDARNGKITTTVANAKGQKKSETRPDDKASTKWVYKWGPYAKIDQIKECRPMKVKFRDVKLNIE